MALSQGATRAQAADIALGADALTATISIHSAYIGILSTALRPLTSGVLGATSLDGVSTINTIEQLNTSINSQ